MILIQNFSTIAYSGLLISGRKHAERRWSTKIIVGPESIRIDWFWSCLMSGCSGVKSLNQSRQVRTLKRMMFTLFSLESNWKCCYLMPSEPAESLGHLLTIESDFSPISRTILNFWSHFIGITSVEIGTTEKNNIKPDRTSITEVEQSANRWETDGNRWKQARTGKRLKGFPG